MIRFFWLETTQNRTLVGHLNNIRGHQPRIPPKRNSVIYSCLIARMGYTAKAVYLNSGEMKMCNYGHDLDYIKDGLIYCLFLMVLDNHMSCFVFHQEKQSILSNRQLNNLD